MIRKPLITLACAVTIFPISQRLLRPKRTEPALTVGQPGKTEIQREQGIGNRQQSRVGQKIDTYPKPNYFYQKKVLFQGIGPKEVTLTVLDSPLLIISETVNHNCQSLTVTAADGYVNIRSEPMVKKGNIVGVLPSGSKVETENYSKGWYEIESPLGGWLASSQVATVSCNRARELLIEVGHPAIEEFGKQAAQGNNAAADTLAKMASGVDGITAEIYSSAIALWAKSKPCFLIRVLEQQDITTRYRVLYALDFGLGSSDSPARQQFESIINKQSPNNLTALAWKDITGNKK